MKPLPMKGVSPDVESYDDLTLAAKVQIGLTLESILQARDDEEKRIHLEYLKKTTLNEVKFHLMNSVDVLGGRYGINYRDSILAFNVMFKEKDPKKRFFTEVLAEDETFSSMVQAKKIVVTLLNKIKKSPEILKNHIEAA